MIDPLPGEAILSYNTVTRLVNVESDKHRILYVEGEPRWEYKFIRRAEDDDRIVQVASMLRTTENKIYRQGIKDPNELADGFPSHAQDLFAYQGLIIGSVEAGYFTPAQQDLIRQFADRRGGGLLFLGGRFGLGDGGWNGSTVADAMPVALPDRKDTFHRQPATVELTPIGTDSLVTRLVDDPTKNVERWKKLPYLMDYQENRHTAKPGAAVLAEMNVGGHKLPLLITQNYGTWAYCRDGHLRDLARWQMSQPLGDNSHVMPGSNYCDGLSPIRPEMSSHLVPSQILADERPSPLFRRCSRQGNTSRPRTRACRLTSSVPAEYLLRSR